MSQPPHPDLEAALPLTAGEYQEFFTSLSAALAAIDYFPVDKMRAVLLALNGLTVDPKPYLAPGMDTLSLQDIMRLVSTQIDLLEAAETVQYALGRIRKRSGRPAS